MPASFSRDSSRTSTTSPGLTPIEPSAMAELLERDLALALVADIDDRVVLADRDHGAAEDFTLLDVVLAEALGEQRRKVFVACGRLG